MPKAVIWVADLIRTFLSLFDRIVYWFIEILISLFDSLSKVQLFNSSNSGIFENFSSRLYFLIAIVMIFKVSFSIIQYIINPDSFSDKERGMGKVIQGIILSLVCLVGVRYVFEGAYKLQEAILDSHIIEKVTLGLDDKGMKATEQQNLKSQIPAQLLSSFVRPNIDVDGISFDGTTYSCNSFKMYEKDDLQEPFFTQCFANLADKEQSTYSIINEAGLKENVTGNAGKLYYTALKYNDYSILLDIINTKKDNDNTVFMFDYKFIVSTVAGIFVVIMYLNFCIDLAIRSVKFAFLQLIAPIPIISMVDPKSSKSGMMSKWVKNCINTYIGLFIRIFAVNFVIFVVNIVFNTKIIGSSEMDVNIFAKVVILFGVLLFAKELPKLITDLTGIDLSGNFKMNPLSRVPGYKAAQTTLGATASGLVGGVAGGIAAGVTHGRLGHNGLLTTGGVLRGLGQGMVSGFAGGVKNHGQHFLQNGFTASKAQSDRVRRNDGTTFVERIGSSISNAIGIHTEDDKSREYERSMENGEKLYNQYNGDITDSNMYKHSDFAEAVKLSSNAKINMIKAQNNFEELQRRAARGENISQSMIDAAGKEAADRETYYETAKNRVDTLGQRYRGDYRNYSDFKAYKDYTEAQNAGEVVMPNSNSATSTTSSATSSNSLSSGTSSTNSSSSSSSSTTAGSSTSNTSSGSSSTTASGSTSTTSSPTRLRVTGLRNPRDEGRVRPSSSEGQIPVSNSGEMPGITPPSRNNGNNGNNNP